MFLFEILTMILDALMTILQALWGALNVWREEPDVPHSATEYADALLFPPDKSDYQDR